MLPLSRCELAAEADDLFVLDVGDLDPADALGQEERLDLGERLDRVPALVLFPDDGRLGALLDRRPDGEAEADALGARDLEVGAVADADLFDLVEHVVGGVAGEVVGHAGLDAEAGEGELADLLELGAERELLVAEHDAGRADLALGVRLGDGHGGVEVVRLGLEGGLQELRVELGGDQVADDVDAVLGGQSGDLVGLARVDLLGREPVLAEALGDSLRLGQVVVGHDHLLEPALVGVAPFGDGGHGLADAAGTDDENLHALHSLSRVRDQARGARATALLVGMKTPPRAHGCRRR